MSADRYDHFGKDGSEKPRRKLIVDWPRVVSGVEILNPDGDYEIQVRREVIPVVLVPGIFGTRLHTRYGEPVWEPCPSLLPSSPGAHFMTSMFLRLGLVWRSLKERQRMLVGERFDPDFLQVPDSTSDRGWRSLTANAYGEIMRRLGRHSWSDTSRLCFELPGHAFGYNWTDDNLHVGELLARYVQDLVAQYEGQGRQCRSVILVAHGTGGLAARAACLLHGVEEMVLGVFHGSQPAQGAPALYHALKAGFSRESPIEEIAADLLGSTGAQVASLLGKMPGPLQMLPREGYVDSHGRRRWLRFQGPDENQITALPGGDPQKEVYGQERYWGLMENVEGELIPDSECISRAWEFHRRLGDLHHPNSYHALGRGRTTAESATFRLSPSGRKKQFGRLKLVPVGDCGEDIITDATGSYRCVYGKGRFAASIAGANGVTLEVVLQPPSGDGDGIVPISSAKALVPKEHQPPGRIQRFREFDGVEHFGFFNDGAVLDYLAAAIEQMCEDHIQQHTGGAHGR